MHALYRFAALVRFRIERPLPAEETFEQILRAILPWLVPLLVMLIAITVCSPLTLWLPNLLMSK